jgi:hypothetical protein
MDPHGYRLVDGFSACGCKVHIAYTREEIPDIKFDIAFVEVSTKFNVKDKIKADIIMIYDCEDDPSHFKPGIAYEELKYSVKYYAKLVYRSKEKQQDGLKYIAIPITNYISLSELAKIQLPEATYKNAVPSFIGTPTFVGSYKKLLKNNKDKNNDVSCVGYFDDGLPMYNQRIDWLDSLQKNNQYYIGGLVFKNEQNHTLEWQTKYFGNVKKFEYPMTDYNTYLSILINYRIGLCPTGYDRISFRLYDLMAVGSIIYLTDIEDRVMLYMPKFYITIPDFNDIYNSIDTYRVAFKDLIDESKINREILKNNTPQKVLQDFMEQLI